MILQSKPRNCQSSNKIQIASELIQETNDLKLLNQDRRGLTLAIQSLTGWGMYQVFLSSKSFSFLCLISLLTWSCQNGTTRFSAQTEASSTAETPADSNSGDSADSNNTAVANHSNSTPDALNSSSSSNSSSSALGSAANPVQMVSEEYCERNAKCAAAGRDYQQYHANITVDKSVFRQGEKIHVYWNSFPEMQRNWITIVPQNFENNSWCTWFWTGSNQGAGFGNVSDIRFGNMNGDAYFVAGKPGFYQIRGYYGWQSVGECEVIGSTTIQIIE